MRDMPGRRPTCLHERTFAGQRTANGIAVSCPRYRVDQIGEYASPYPINGAVCSVDIQFSEGSVIGNDVEKALE